MDKNIKLLFCILGSAILTLLSSPIFGGARFSLFSDGYGGHPLGELIVFLSNFVSFIGFILLMIFSILLIINNIRK